MAVDAKLPRPGIWHRSDCSAVASILGTTGIAMDPCRNRAARNCSADSAKSAPYSRPLQTCTIRAASMWRPISSGTMRLSLAAHLLRWQYSWQAFRTNLRLPYVTNLFFVFVSDRYSGWYSPVCYSIWLNSATSEGLASKKSPLRGKPICNINLRVLFRSVTYYVYMCTYVFAHMPNFLCMYTIIVYLAYHII